MIVPWIDLALASYAAGFRGEAHSVAIALAQPESGRNTDAVNSSDPNGGSFGLLQINGVHDPKATGEYPNMVPTAEWKELMKDPIENYKLAYKVYTSANGSFNPWGAFTSNLHVPYLAIARVAMDARARIARLEIINQNHVLARETLQKELASVRGQLEIEKSSHTTTQQMLALVESELATAKADLTASEERAASLDSRLVAKNNLIDQARAV